MVYVSKPCRECGGPHFKSFLCQECYNRSIRKNPDFEKTVFPDGTKKPCRVPECGRPVQAKMLCQSHGKESRLGVPFTDLNAKYLCPVNGCSANMARWATICKNHMRFGWRYSISPEDVIALWENPVCSNPGCNNTDRLHMDHDHNCCPTISSKNKFSCGECNRGLLCHGCNVALGMLGDSRERMEGLLKYLNAKTDY